ncbi:hypothetical protein IVB14_24905 [Bradyrhizobium sp. 180]|nr:hypothetical protein [Bradyrhizobium sp. 180]
MERIERKGGIVVAKSNVPEFRAGGSTFNEVFGRTRNSRYQRRINWWWRGLGCDGRGLA